MKILALDQATNITAWCVWDENKPIKYDVIDIHKEKNINARTDFICLEIKKIMYAEWPTLLVIEDVSFQRDAQALINLARLQGRILQMAYELGVPVVFYKPSSWRKSVGIKTGKGIKRKELKEAAISLVADEYGINVSEDVAEAICIGKCGLLNIKD